MKHLQLIVRKVQGLRGLNDLREKSVVFSYDMQFYLFIKTLFMFIKTFSSTGPFAVQ